MKAQVKSLIDTLNKGYQCGNISLIDYSESNFDEYGCEPDDIIIYGDFSDSDDDQVGREQPFDEYDSACTRTHNFMLDNGYEQVAESDGSGGGLFYGFTAYRKIT